MASQNLPKIFVVATLIAEMLFEQLLIRTVV